MCTRATNILFLSPLVLCSLSCHKMLVKACVLGSSRVHKSNTPDELDSVSKIFRYIAYTEQRENHGSMILHGANYSAYTVL